MGKRRSAGSLGIEAEGRITRSVVSPCYFVTAWLSLSALTFRLTLSSLAPKVCSTKSLAPTANVSATSSLSCPQCCLSQASASAKLWKLVGGMSAESAGGLDGGESSGRRDEEEEVDASRCKGKSDAEVFMMEDVYCDRGDDEDASDLDGMGRKARGKGRRRRLFFNCTDEPAPLRLSRTMEPLRLGRAIKTALARDESTRRLGLSRHCSV